MSLKSLIAFAVAAAFAAPLAAQQQAPGGAAGTTPGAAGATAPGASFEDLDKNKDGSLSREEMKGSPKEKDFSSLDKDNDGKLSRGEYGAASGGAAVGGTKPAEPKK